MQVYPALIFNEKDSGYRVRVPDVENCEAKNSSLSQALDEARHVLGKRLEALLLQGMLPPEPTDIGVIHQSGEHPEAFALAAIEIDLASLSQKFERVNITLPSWLIARIDANARNRSKFLANGAIERLQRQSCPGSQGQTSSHRKSANDPAHGARLHDAYPRSRYDWTHAVPTHVLSAMAKKAVRRRYKDGSFLFRAGEWDGTLYQIVEGAVHLKGVTAGGKEALLSVHRAGSCIGVTTSLCELEHVYDGVAKGHLVVDCLAQTNFRELRQKYPEIDSAISEWAAHRIWELMILIRGDSVLDLPGRLALHIDYLLEHLGSAGDERGKLELSVSQEMLAAAAGASRQAVGRVIREWRKSGLVEYGYGRIKVLDRDRFARIFQI
jgi:CRP-like cAMP-binding protein/predicted RNase H-like HicB family nuclease